MTNRELNIVGRALTILQGFDKFYIKTPWWALLTVLGALYGAVFSYILATHISGAPANNNAVLDHSLFQLVAMFIIFVGLPKAIYTLGFRDFSPSRMLLKTIIFMVILFASGEVRIPVHSGHPFRFNPSGRGTYFKI